MAEILQAQKSRAAVQGWLTKAIFDLQKTLDDPNSDTVDLEHALANINKRLEAYEEAQAKVENLVELDDIEKEIQIASVHTDKASEVIRKANRKLRKLQKDEDTDSNSSNRSHTTSIKLPKLELPKFHGDVTKFQEFWDQFESNVDQSDLPVVSKFTYLKGLLQGEAKATIDGLTLTEAHYATACDILKERFGRTELVVYTHIQSLITLQPDEKLKDGLSKLKNLMDKVNVHIRSLEALGITGDKYGVTLTPVILSRLPNEVRMEWAREGKGKEGDLPWLLDFLKKEIERHERADTFKLETKPKDKDVEKKNVPRRSSKSTASALRTSSEGGCAYCNKANHALDKCWSFKKLQGEDRKKAFMDSKLCFKCASTGHYSKSCNAECSKCKGGHHRLLCNGQGDQSGLAKSEPEKKDDAPCNTTCAAQSVMQTVLLQTAKVQVKTPGGRTVAVNILFDSGSDRSYICSDVANKLKLSKIDTIEHKYAAFGGGKSRTSIKPVVEINLLDSQNESCKIEAIEVPVICAPLNKPAVPVHALKLPGVNYAGPCTGVKIDILIGVDFYWKLVGDKVIRIDGDLVAQESRFGYILSGRVQGKNCTVTAHQLLCFNDVNEDHLRRFWELDHIGIKSEETVADGHVLKSFEESVQYENGRYKVALPWKQNAQNCIEDNSEIAMKRLLGLKKRFSKEPELETRYNAVLSDLEQKGIIEEVPEAEKSETPNCVFYLPHHPVVKESSTSTKVRPVFDGSAKGTNGYSLNDCLESGPSLLPDLVAVLIRFRRWSVALAADITKAFLQVSLREEDRDVHRFLWMCNGKTRTMRFTRVTFGVNSSPFLLNATIKHHLEKFRDHHDPQVILELEENLYVDDWLTGGDTTEEAQAIHEEGCSVMQKAGMDLAKWQSNALVFTDKSESQTQAQGPENCGPVKVLGISWSKADDAFVFNGIELPSDLLITKRLILSLIARVFDPMGFLNPFMMLAKILFQRLWKIGLDWDEEVPDDLHEKFSAWLDGLSTLKGWMITRRYSSVKWSESSASMDLHVFCDAAETGYGAAVYIRCPQSGETSLILSKARVAPVKKMTLPRLELLGCLLAARLLNFVKNALHLKDAKYFLRTDSTVALGWLKGDPARWKPFVANRVTEIQQLTDPSCWSHIAGEKNPADLLTRGISAKQLIKCEEFWLRPNLSYLIDETVETFDEPETEGCDENEDKDVTLIATCSEANQLFDINRWSTLDKAVRISQYCLNFISKLRSSVKAKKSKDQVISKPSSDQNRLNKPDSEIQDSVGQSPDQDLPSLINDVCPAMKILVLEEQKSSYPAEIELLQKEKLIPKHSKLYHLNPFLDVDGIMRVQGRVQNSELSYSAKHPVILPNGWLAKLLVRFYHKKTHSGVTTLLTVVRNNYWISGLRKVAKTVVKECVSCQKLMSKPLNQSAAPLPEERTTQRQPFSYSGVDYAGPLFVSDINGKTYICLFTCAVIRAIHLELVGSQSSDDFILAFRRFASRRGLPTLMQSDNAKTFVGAQSGLKKLYGDHAPEWRFITPRSPWHGGYWERMVRSVKSALKKTVQNKMLTRLQLETLLVEIEFAINSRPLTEVTDGIDDPRPLTPNDFLLSKFSGAEKDVRSIASKQQDSLRRFWKCWRDDYIRNLPKVVPKFKAQGNLQEGAIVLISDDNQPRLKWPLGKVVKIYPGDDGKVRSVKLRTSSGELVRPVQRLHQLEMVEPLGPEEPCVLSEPTKRHEREESETKVPVPVPVASKTRAGRKIKPVQRLDL